MGRPRGTGTPRRPSAPRASSRCRRAGRSRSRWPARARCSDDRRPSRYRRQRERPAYRTHTPPRDHRRTDARDTAVSTERITHLIGGTPWTGVSERTSKVYNPATGEVTGELDLASAATVDEAVKVAHEASKAWGRTSLTKRAQVLFAFRELLNERKGDIAALITAEHGKVLSDALGEVTRGLEVVEFACGIPHLLKGGFSENVSTNVDVYSIRQSLGAVAVISPFNFPAMVPMWFIPIAIACGNAVVLKPSEKDPSAAVAIAELWT